MAPRYVQNEKELAGLVQELGFLPFFTNEIRGFSVEEHCPPALWFAEDADGPWEWKGPVARTKTCVYGKFFGGKAGFVSLDWLPDFANYRRNGYDFDARYDEGLASCKDRAVYNVIAERGKILSRELRSLCNYRKGGSKGFESVITRLQMQCYVSIADFVYMQDRFGRTYGWGVAAYSTPEALFGYAQVTAAYSREPEDSRQRILAHLSRILPQAAEEELLRLIG